MRVNSSSLQWKQRSGPFARYAGRSPSFVTTSTSGAPMKWATSCAALRSAEAKLGDTPMIATTRAGPRNAPARASRTEGSTPPENATPSRSTTCSCERTRSTRAWSTPNAVSSGTVLLSLAYSDGSSDHSAWKAPHGPRDRWCGRRRVPHSLYRGGGKPFGAHWVVGSRLRGQARHWRSRVLVMTTTHRQLRPGCGGEVVDGRGG